MNSEELLKDLLERAEGLPLRDEDALDRVSRRTEMLIRRIFGESHSHQRSFDRLNYYPGALDSSEGEYDEVWRSGQRSLINLISTMREEIQVFESSPTPVLSIHDDEFAG